MLSSSSCNEQYHASQQDDWINVLTGMDNFLETEENVDALNLGSPILPPLNVNEGPGLSGLSSFSLPPNPIPTVNVVENSLTNENKATDATSGQDSAEIERPPRIPPTLNAAELKKNDMRRAKPVVTSRSDQKNSKNAISAAAKAQARSERKRSREKQRRIDVNSQIVELTNLLVKIEADERNELDESAPSTSKRSKSVNIPSNRVDLISRTIALLKRLHSENKKRNRDVVELKEKLTEVKELHQAAQKDVPAKPVIMMMPMMLPANSVNGGQQAICMPQAMQVPLQMQIPTQQLFSSASQTTCSVQNTIHSQEVTPVMTSYPPVMQNTSQPVLQQQMFCYPQPSNIMKPEKANNPSFTTAVFDSSQINLSSGGNLAHCA